MKTITVHPPKIQLAWIIPLCGLMAFRLGVVILDPEYFGPATSPLVLILDALNVLLLLILIKHLIRVLGGGPSLVIDNKGIFFHTNLLYGPTQIGWQDIADINPVTYRSPREIAYRSLKIVPKDNAAFLSGFSPLKRMLVRMATSGAGSMIDIPQMMLDRKVDDIMAEIKQLRENE